MKIKTTTTTTKTHGKMRSNVRKFILYPKKCMYVVSYSHLVSNEK